MQTAGLGAEQAMHQAFGLQGALVRISTLGYVEAPSLANRAVVLLRGIAIGSRGFRHRHYEAGPGQWRFRLSILVDAAKTADRVSGVYASRHEALDQAEAEIDGGRVSGQAVSHRECCLKPGYLQARLARWHSPDRSSGERRRRGIACGLVCELGCFIQRSI